MDLIGIAINTRNWVNTTCECDIGPPGFISHGVSAFILMQGTETLQLKNINVNLLFVAEDIH